MFPRGSSHVTYCRFQIGSNFFASSHVVHTLAFAVSYVIFDCVVPSFIVPCKFRLGASACCSLSSSLVFVFALLCLLLLLLLFL